jgi:nitroreductase
MVEINFQNMTENPESNRNQVASYSKPMVEIIKQRYSCRTYRPDPLDRDIRVKLADYAAGAQWGPLGSQARFELIAASENDHKALKSLGTYGFIKGATGFIVGAIKESKYNLEDFGYLLEQIIIYATDLGLGTCWLGGTFTKSSFAKKVSAREGELVPGVASVGYIAKKPRRIESILKRNDGTDRRLPWDRLFFDGEFNTPLPHEGLRKLGKVLEMVRLSPSASNRQPWRLVREGSTWHFYLQRTPGYRESPLVRLTTVADLQRIDMGIAMSHFELTAYELGLDGQWQNRDPEIERTDELTEYLVSWVGNNSQ